MKERLLSEIHKLDDNVKQLKTVYDPNDIRVSFFEYIYTILAFYYQNLCFVTNSEDFLKAHKEISKKPELSIRDLKQLDIPKFYEISNNSKMLLDSWSMFELAVTLLSDRFVSINEKEDILNKNYNDIKKIFPQLDCNQDEKLKKKLQKKHFTLSSINDKYNKLFKLIELNYNKIRDLSTDKIFLENLGCLRNGIHSNYIYFGNSRLPFVFKDFSVTFENGKTIKFDYKDGVERDDVILDLVLELCEIFTCLIDSIGNKSCVDNPASNLYEIVKGERPTKK